MHSTEVQVIGTQVPEIPEGSEQIELQFISGLAVPVNGQLVMIPDGVYRFALTLEGLEKLESQIAEQRDKLAKKSDLIVTGNMGDAERIAAVTQGLRK
jgi:hypothetical protein